MMLKIVEFDKEKEYIDDFLVLPKRIYTKSHIMQNEKEEENLLLGEHVLSKYFKLQKFLIYSDQDVVGRFVITTYENDETAYIGFFECIESEIVGKFIFAEAEKTVKLRGYHKILGPVDASFWIKYRLKTNQFSRRPYTSEPYNKEYYYKMFLENGYLVVKKYFSNHYNKVPIVNLNRKKFIERYQEFSNKGYQFESPNKKNFDTYFKEVYRMIMELYCDFPIFKFIKEDDFTKHFSFFKYILDYSFVKIVYKEEKVVAFFICIPDYQNMLYGKLSWFKYIKIMLKRIRSNNYISLYMGVDKSHKGLGKAITNTIINELCKKNASSIGALIKDNNLNVNYIEDEIDFRYEYVLLEREF